MINIDLLLIDGTCVTWCEKNQSMIEILADVAIHNGKIIDFGAGLLSSQKYSPKAIKSYKGCHIFPGCIDSQVHFREPGLEHKEDLETGTRAALVGGITAVFEMPNTNPSTTTMAALEDKLSRMQSRAWTHYAFYIGATPDNALELEQIEKHPHCSGIKIFMGSSTGSLLVDEEAALERILSHGYRRVIVHSEDESRLKERKYIAIDEAHPRAHPVWRDAQSAILSTERLLRVARKTKRRIHVLHVSTADEIQLLAKNKDIATVEVLPQHLTLAAPECYEQLGTFAQMNPPIREKNHQAGLWAGILDGTVDVLGSDHAPHTKEEKNKIYPQSPSGMPGVQTILPLILTHAVNGKLPLTRAVELMTEGPRRVFNIQNKGRLQKGFDADITVVKLNETYHLDETQIISKCGWSPFVNFEFKAKIQAVYLDGQLAMENGLLQPKPLGKAVTFASDTLS